MIRRVIILGSTGSIGTQTLDVIEHLNTLAAASPSAALPRFEVVGLAAGNNAKLLAHQAARFGVRHVALLDPHAPLDAALKARRGTTAAEALVREVEADIVVAAMVGASGLPATLAAVQLGRDIALANKETLVAAGALIIPAARASGSRLLPVDSEHAAVWQCLLSDPSERHNPGAAPLVPPLTIGSEVAKIILTASGGPFRTWTRERAYDATPAQALAHPTWSMGAKVTIDSASLTNKAFEVIEAHWLFGAPAQRIGVLIHPQSIVHSLVEFADGNIMAQLGPPDMRAPIQFALTFPNRQPGRSHTLDFTKLSKLEFEPPDTARFPALKLAYNVITAGGGSGAIFNAASEEATMAFLDPAGPRLSFGRMPELAAEALAELGAPPVRSLAEVMDLDARARAFVRARLAEPTRTVIPTGSATPAQPAPPAAPARR